MSAPARNIPENKEAPATRSKPKTYLKHGQIYLRTAAGAIPIARGIRAVNMLSDDSGTVCGIALEIGTKSQVRHCTLEIADLAQPMRLWVKLVSMGVKVRNRPNTLQLLRSFLLQQGRKRKRVVVNREGHHRIRDGERTAEFYQIGDRTFGTLPRHLEAVVPSPNIRSTYSEKGSLRMWQEKVGRRCVGNPLLTTLLCAGMSAPVNAITGRPNVGAAGAGDSSLGKTACLRAVQSLCGNDYPLSTFGGTAKGLLAFAAAHPHRPAVIDELGLADSHRDALRFIYAVGDQANRLRDRGDGRLRDDAPIEAVLVMAGEQALSDYALDVSSRAGSGYAARVLTFPCDEPYGCFSCLHGAPSARAFVEQLEAATATHNGVFWPAFIRKLFEDPDRIRRWDREHFDKIRERLRTRVADRLRGSLDERVVKGAATWAFAGRIAVEFGLVPWEKKWPSKAIERCLAGLFENMTPGATPAAMRVIAAIRRTLETQGHRRFMPLSEYGERVPSGSLAGYRHEFRDGTRVFLFLPTVFEPEFIAEYGRAAVIPALRRAGLLLAGEHGAPTKEVRLPGTGGKKARFYAIREAILFD